MVEKESENLESEEGSLELGNAQTTVAVDIETSEEGIDVVLAVVSAQSAV